MNRLDCSIVRDLLPLYADGLTSEESNRLIGEHLNECADCRAVEEAMSRDIMATDTNLNGEVDYLQKIKKKRRRMLIATVITCIVVFAIISAVGIKEFVIGETVAYYEIDADPGDNYVGIGTAYNEETNELTLYGELIDEKLVFSSIKVERDKYNAYIVTVYGARALFPGREYNRKFEETITLPDAENFLNFL